MAIGLARDMGVKWLYGGLPLAPLPKNAD